MKYIKTRTLNDVSLVIINRPEASNALNESVLLELEEALKIAERDKAVKVLILTGALIGDEKAFVAGADIGEMVNMTPDQAKAFAALGCRVLREIEMMEKPVIAAVNGYALGGGCELALACDIRIASERAIFGQPEVGLGILPGFAGTQRLSRLIGVSKAKELIFTGDIISAEAARELGLVNQVVKHGNLIDDSILLAKKIASKGQVAVRYAKMAINAGIETDLESGIIIENDLFGLCFTSHDQKEGMKAFLDRRKPNFES